MAIQKDFHSLIVWLLISSFFVGLSWTALIPMWQTPDEQAHFAQAQDITAIGYKPNPGASTSQDIVLSEEYLGTFRDERGNNRFTYHPEFNIEYTNSSIGLYEKEMINFPEQLRTDFIINEATGYPPLYYWYIAAVNKLFWNFDLITRVFLSRVATVILTTMAVLVSYFLAREVFKNEFHAIAAAALISFHPMWKFVGSGVTSDALFNLIYPFGLWLLIRFWRRPEKLERLLAYMAVAVIGVMTKIQAVSLLVLGIPILVAMALGRYSAPAIGRWLSRMVLLIVVLVVGTALIRSFPNSLKIPLPIEVVFPEINSLTNMGRPPSFGAYAIATGKELYQQTFPWYFGVYRWLSLTLPLWLYRVIKVVIIASLFGWIRLLFKTGNIVKTLVRKRTVLVILMSVFVYASGLLVWNYLYWKSHGFPFGIQGRYFFPNLPEHMIFLLAGLLLLVPVTWRRFMAISSLVTMILFHWYSLWFISSTYYDSSNIQTFFLQASQYKPWFFKTPFLPVLLAAAIASNMIFLWKLIGYRSSLLEKKP